MAGDMPRHPDSYADRQRVHTRDYKYSCSPETNPRSSPPLYKTESGLTTEPRNLTRIDHYDDNYYHSGYDNYTHTSASNDASTNYTKRLVEFIGDEDLQRLADLKLGETCGLDNVGTNDNRDIPRSTRSYAEVVKTSSPTKGSTRSTYQLPPARPKSPKQRFCEAAKLHAESQAGIETPNKLRHVADKPSKSERVCKLIGHDNTVGTTDKTTINAQRAHQLITRGVSLDENKLRTTYQRQSATQGNRNLASRNHAAARNSYPARAHTTDTASFSDTTKGIGEWAVTEPIHVDQSLCADVSRCVSTSSRHYQAPLSFDPVIKCAAGNSKSSGSERDAAFPTSRPTGIAKGGRGDKRSTGRAHKKGVHDGGDGDGSDDNSNDFEGPKDSPGPPSPPLKWYACPFHKHNPSYFCTNDLTRMRYKTCSAKGWTDISRLKEHLYRVHIDRTTCDTCQFEFASEEELKVHCPYPEFASCLARPRVSRVSKGILPDVEKSLRKRPQKGMTNEDRWFAIWMLLFPDEERPSSPYSDVQVVESLQEFMDQRMHDHFTAKLRNAFGEVAVSQEVKEALIKIAAEQEKSSRHDLIELYQTKDSPSPGPVSEEGESPDAEIVLPATTQPALEAMQNPNFLSQHSNRASLSSSHYDNLPDPVVHPQTYLSAHRRTPAYPNQIPRPRTPAQFSSSSKSGDSAYHSGSNGFPSGLSEDGQYVDPAYLTSPTPLPYATRNNMVRHNINTITDSGQMSYAKAAGKQPLPSVNAYKNPDTPMYDLTDEDALGSPAYR